MRTPPSHSYSRPFHGYHGLVSVCAVAFPHRRCFGNPGSAYNAGVRAHGGSQRQMYGALHFSQTYAQLNALSQHLALGGIPVLSINYRSGVGYGRNYRLCGPPSGPPTRRCGMRGALEYDDVRAGGCG